MLGLARVARTADRAPHTMDIAMQLNVLHIPRKFGFHFALGGVGLPSRSGIYAGEPHAFF